ncbi:MULTISPECIES: nicotinate phosphoribosyltransferase [unclassified Nitratiruptor]|uniref:nicotinate phosphoribosyltransferase n=1 Tax=unclassified Nitratiruptor TaxID=2624044 RepID=UPI0019154DAD|nr:MULTISPECIES: nicotinate phosphoribosyltransferase [unclassified Nitratiruptor]BCD60211.1 nicotinate phosphoribosyltransferase [Nitratiruptor sp. YY08-10]BCD64300.1 nicotinate phosphoribosyltransferase [Nitratiruptor sp. YY08-14]
MQFGFVDAKNFPMLTDLYELTMAQVYFEKGMNKEAIFEFFIRPTKKRPYFVMAGLEQLLYFLQYCRFSDSSIEYLRGSKKFSESFLEYLKHFRFSGDVWAVSEGEIVFANEPLVTIKANLIEAQIIETFLINTLQYSILIATKAARCKSVAQNTKLVDFGLRRAHGMDAGLKAARSSYIAGFLGTSNVLAGKIYDIPIFGTMAHSFILAHESELQAFKDFIQSYPDNAILLIDTYDSIRGIKYAIEAVQEMGLKHFKGIRLDSGDLEILSKKARKLLDEAGFKDAIILASGGINEYTIDALLQRQSPIDAWGVGTELVVSADVPYLDCAYKMVEYAGKPKMKLSSHKKTLPGQKQIFRRYDGNLFKEDIVDTFDSAYQESESLVQKWMEKGKLCRAYPKLPQIREYFEKSFQMIPTNLKDIYNENPYIPKIGIKLEKKAQTLQQYLKKGNV